MVEVEDPMTNFDVRIIKFDTSLEITRKLGGQHNQAQHSGRESTVPQTMNNFLQLAADDAQCKKTVVTVMCEAIVEVGLTAKSGNNEEIVKQTRPAALMALMCGTTFTDALGKMVERKQVIALIQCDALLECNPKICGVYATTWPRRRVLYRASTSWQRSSKLGNCGGITLVIPTCRLSASTLQDVCCCFACKPPVFCCDSDSVGRCDKEPG